MASRSPTPRRPALRALGAAAALVVLAGCGGPGGPDPAPAQPGANVDPSAGGSVGGPINRAKKAAEQQEQRDAEVERSGGP